MRRLFLAVSCPVLLLGLGALWSHRFERVSGVTTLGLSALKLAAPILPAGATWVEKDGTPGMRMEARPGQPRIAVRVPLQGFPTVEALHVRFNVAARNLTLGSNKWDDGRVLIEWRNPDGSGGQETDTVCSARDCESSGDVSLVLRAASGSAVPVLRIEHLGRSGEFGISRLEITAVEEREIWQSGCWVLMGAWFVWLWAFFSGPERRSPWRNCLAACVSLGMGLYCAVPGPWKTLRPLIVDFVIGKPQEKAVPTVVRPRNNGSPSPAPDSGTLVHPAEPLGNIPLQGGWMIQAKQHLAKLRPLLHASLLFAPALVLAILVGSRKAIELSASLAVAIEAAQTAFGYGFDWVDVMDLVTDAIGIAFAIWVLAKWRARKSTSPSAGG